MLFISRIKIHNFKSFKLVDVTLPKTYVCLAGPNGSGKCVDGDTEVYLSDGTGAKIRDLVDDAICNGYTEKIDDGFIAQIDNPKEIFSIDPKTLKIVRKRIGAFVKRRAPEKMLRIATRSGRTVTATEYHPLFILDGDKIRSIRADELKKGVRIAIPRALPVYPISTLFLEFLDSITLEDNLYVPYDANLAKIIKIAKGSEPWSNLSNKSGVPLVFITSFMNSKQSIQFSYLVRILRSSGLSNFDIADKIKLLKGDSCGEPMQIRWANSNDFCRFLGYLLAEGSISKTNNQLRLTNGSEEIIHDYVAIAKSLFGINAHVYKYKKGSFDVVINNVALRNILIKFGMSYDGADGKFISDSLFTHSTDENLGHLLAGLYAGDGYVSKNSVEITLKSEKLIHGIASILLRLGIVPRIKKIIKRETKTNFVGTYFKISIFSVEDIKKFYSLVPIIHTMKKERLGQLVLRESNPNVDLIEANGLVKKAAHDLKINVKSSKINFPRIDAYCYNQCLPSRSGINHIIENLFEPVAISNGVQSQTLGALRALASSDIFWDEISDIEVIPPREEWVYDLSIGETHNFIANGIFVHNSNVLDAIRFACGEISLKSLRAKKVRDLILSGTNAAEVTVYFDGDEKIEIKRAIRTDGKILYKLNGVKTTRGAIVELLKKHNVDESGRNTIAQGEVQRIINMGGKERRQIIDAVAGISDFEAKKDEAMRELEQVNNKIKDANLVLGEKDALLAQLERERADALVYLDAKKNLANAKGTLLEREIKKLDSDLTEVCESEQKTKAEIEKRESAIAKADADIKRVDSARLDSSKELQAKQQTAGIIRRIEELKALLATKEQMVKDKEELAKRLEKEVNGLNVDAAGKKSSVTELEKEISQLKKDFVALESENEKFSSFKSSGELEKLEKQISELDDELRSKRERTIAIDAEIRSKREIADLKRQEQDAIDSTLPKESENAKAEERIQKMKSEIKGLAEEIDSLFKREKELNSESAELDKKLLELREKHSVMRVQSSPALSNPALKFVQELKNKGSVDGIYGTVADLIRFDTKYTAAIEAAGGNRLLYVVVEDSNTASKIISLLKKASAGRATFIPLKEVKTAQQPDAMNGFKSIINVMEFSSDVARAVEYVFAETLLVDSMEDAKRIGLRHARMVTLDGEIFERSGIISGGKVASSVLASTQLAKIEEEISKVKEEKASIMQELLDSRESASKLRSKKAELEVKAKSAEIEIRGSSEVAKSREKALARKKQLETEIADATSSADSLTKESEKLVKAVSELESRLLKAKEQRDAELEKERSSADQTSKKKADLAAKVSSMRATIEGKLKEAELRKNELFKLEERIKIIQQEKMDAVAKVAEMKKASGEEGKELAQQEEKISSTSRQIERIFETIKKYETELQVLGSQREKARMELDRVAKDMNQLNVKRATVETKLADLKAEFDGHGQYETLSMNKEELHTLVKSSEVTITTMTNVNMAAIDMYGKKKSEIEEIRGKIKTLDDERNAILMMMDEISQKKKDAFFKTFHAVNDYFRKMFAYISIGEGFIYLDKPEDPFESGMYIKLKRNNREHTLDSLSGGENSLVALMFIFAMQLFKPSPFYVLDEVDAALDKDNSKNLAHLIKRMSEKTQFMVVSHNDTTMALADSVLGVTKVSGVSKLVGVRLEQRPQSGNAEQVEVIQ